MPVQPRPAQPMLPFRPAPDAHTPHHLSCPACAAAEQMYTQAPSASMSFPEAAAQYLAVHSTVQENHHIRYMAPRTLEDWRRDIEMAQQFFGGLRLDQIEPYHFRSYQLARASGDGFVRRMGGPRKGWTEVPTVAGAATINDELDLVRRIMVDAGAWTPLHSARYRKLQEPDNDIPKAASPEEQEHFLNTARRDSETHVIWWYSLVARATTFSFGEMVAIRQGDINFDQQILAFNRNRAKNAFRRRQIPIADADCMWALEQLAQRSTDLPGPDGSPLGRHPGHYLFPRRIVRARYDGFAPTGKGGSLREPFRLVAERAGMSWFTLNCWRHTAITNLAVAGVPIATIMSLAGHVSPKMSAHYTHISEQAQRLELERVYQRGRDRRVPPQRAGAAGSTLASWGAERGPAPIRSFFPARVARA